MGLQNIIRKRRFCSGQNIAKKGQTPHTQNVQKNKAPDSEEDLCVEDDQGNKWDHAGEEQPRPVCVISRRVEEISRNGENMY